MSVVRVGTRSRFIDIDNLANKEGDNLEDTVQEYLQPAAVGDVKLQGQDETLDDENEVDTNSTYTCALCVHTRFRTNHPYK